MLEYSSVAINTDMNKINVKASIYMIVYSAAPELSKMYMYMYNVVVLPIVYVLYPKGRKHNNIQGHS